MKELDGRKISREALEEIRIRAVRRVEAGESPEVVIKALGFTRGRIYEWLAKYREGGIEALRRKKAPGKKPKLDGKQLQKIYRLVVGENPLQLKFEFALWTRGMVQELIKREFGINLNIITVGRLLHKLGLTPQRPKRKAYQQDEYYVLKWMAEDFKKIKQLAVKENADIFFGDESAVRSDYHSNTPYAVRGKTPVVRTTGSRHKVNLISVISPRGEMRFMATEGNVTAEVFIEFLKRVITKAQNRIFLILDNSSVHRSTEVRNYVKSTHGRLRIFFLPPCSPELNPDEHVWNYLKNHNFGRQDTKNGWDLYTRVIRVMRSLQKYPDKIRSFFQHQWTKYTLVSAN
jgi:transposase